MSDYMSQYKRQSSKPKNVAGKGTPKPGELWWASNVDGIKDRPVLIVGQKGGDFTFRKCTSQTSMVKQRDVIEDYYEAGLEKATYVDPDRCTIGRNRLLWKVGELSDYDRSKFGL